jgi:type II secretory ATPase GspE/PulE/Tfp pilus assembly ATPase PilB-like protein
MPLDNVEVRLMDGSSVKGQLDRVFHPMEEEVAVRSHGSVHTIPLGKVCAILFQSEPGEPYPPPLPGEVIEDVRTRDNRVYTVRVLQQQAITDLGQGFYGIPYDATSGLKRIFFSRSGILSRRQHRPIGEILKEGGAVSDEHIQEALNEQAKLKKRRIGEIIAAQQDIPQKMIDEALKKSKAPKTEKTALIGDILVAANLVTREQVEEALEEQRKGGHKQLGEILIERKIITEDQLLMALALKFRMRFVDLRDISPKPETLELVPAELARQLHIFPIDSDDKKITIATSQPTNLAISDALRFHTGLWVEMVVATPKQIEDYIDRYYTGENELGDINIEETGYHEPEEETPSKTLSLKDEAETAPIVRLANKILLDGIRSRASDIHLLPQEDGLKVSFRINGLLQQHIKLDRRIHRSLVARFKITAGMDIAQHRLPQDGRIQVQMQNRKVEFRVSCMPGLYGENLVLRILDKSGELIGLHQLGIRNEDIKTIRQLVRSAHGMFLVTGPTGSGKSTTLISVLRDLVDEPKHLLSLEDPIEAEVAGINQIQINEKIGFTFATALRNVLRHDPDIIMVGEIRDPETAKIATQAALTGHVLISSLHTNRAAGAFSRLVDMGVESYLVGATVKGVMAQYLLPKLCEHCRKPCDPDPDAIDFLGRHGIEISKPVDHVSTGCDQCRDTGVSGRVMVYEFLQVDKQLQKLISGEATEESIQEAACKAGMHTMVHMAVEASQQGLISIDRIMPLLID